MFKNFHITKIYREYMESIAFKTILFLVISNLFMTVAWYGHLKFKEMHGFENLGLFAIIFISWGLAFFEYCFMIPANRMGFIDNGGPYTLVELKVMQEVITLVVFTFFTIIFFKDQKFTTNDFIGFGFLVLAVYFIFKK
jgi:uncharacterized protein